MTLRKTIAATFLAVLLVGCAMLAVALVSRGLGLGTGREFLLFKLVGVSRGVLAAIGMSLATVAVLIAAASGPTRSIVSGWISNPCRWFDRQSGSRVVQLASMAIAWVPMAMRRLKGNVESIVRGQERIVWRHELPILAAHCASLVIFGAVTFAGNRGHLFHGLDGSYLMTLVAQQYAWTEPSLGLTNNFFQSLGNIWIPVNSWLFPALVSSLDGGERVNPVWAYVVFSSELFVSVYAFCIFLLRDRLVAALAAWGMVLLVMPLSGKPLLYEIYGLAPQNATLVALTMAVLTIFGQVGRHGVRHSILGYIFAATLVAWVILMHPTHVVIILPTLLFFAVGPVLAAGSRIERVHKLLLPVFVLVVLVAIGIPQLIVGFYGNTAAYFMSSEMINDRQTLKYASILFHDRSLGGTAGPRLFVAALCGGLAAAYFGRSYVRFTALGMLLFMALLVVIGAIVTFFDFWRGPSPLYFEFFLWPMYLVFAAVALRIALSLPFAYFSNGENQNPAHIARIFDRRTPVVASLLVALAPWLLYLAFRNTLDPAARDFAYPPTVTPIVAHLKDEIGFVQGGAYRGRVATFTGHGIPKPISWFDLHNFDLALVKDTANDYRMVGLWYFDVPTLQEYNQAITPTFFAAVTRLFARPGDKQVRSVLTLRRVQVGPLRLFGVRYVITDEEIGGAVNLRMHTSVDRGRSLYLYELEDVNIGNFSPTRARVFGTAKEVLAALTVEDFDGKKEVLVNSAVPEDLVAASSVRMTTEKGHLRISARSSGLSLLVLPLEYSHCLQLKDTVSPASAPYLLRANLVQTGLVFSSSIDTSIEFYFGPFRNSGCRLEDMRDMQRVEIRNVSR